MNHHRNKTELISIVVPVFNEAGNIMPLYRELCRVFEEEWYDFEIVFVDDGSTDETTKKISRLHSEDQRVKLVSFSRNFGHQMALTAGMAYAQGVAVISMDGDLQHPPSLIPEILRKWKDGYDVVHTVREDSQETSWFKKQTSAWYYRIVNRLIKTQIIPNAADFRLLDRSVLDTLKTLPERNRFVRGLIPWVGYRQTSISYKAQPRFSGTTKYSVRKMLSFALSGITSFSTTPLRVSAYMGFFAAFACLPYALWAVYLALFTVQSAPGWASILVAVVFFGGVQLISLGILGEYVGRIYDEVKRRPLYIVREKIGFEENAPSERRVPEEQSPSLDEQESFVV